MKNPFKHDPENRYRYELKELLGLYSILLGLLGILVLLLTCGCSLLGTQGDPVPDPQRIPAYRYDLQVSINGRAISGMGVVPRASKYEVEVYPEDSIDRIIWTTCNRQEVVDRPEKGFWDRLRGDNAFRFTLDPTLGLENVKACPLEISVLTERKTRTGFALIDFGDARPEYQKISAKLKCNGSQIDRTGVGVCQSASGLVQEIVFDREVLPGEADAGCARLSDVDGKRLRYRLVLAPGRCLYVFGDRDGNRFRLTTFGYTEVPYRE